MTGGAVQESLFAGAQSAQPSTPFAVAAVAQRLEAEGSPAGGEGGDAEDFVSQVLRGVFGFYTGRGGLWGQLRLLGVDDAGLLAKIPTMFSMGGGARCNVRPAEEPALVYEPATGEGFSLTGEELCARVRVLFDIPQPKPAEEAARLVAEQVEEERRRARAEASALVKHIAGEKKVPAGLAAACASRLYGEGFERREAQARACEEIYRLLLESGVIEPHRCMIDAGNIVHQASVVWGSVLRRNGLAQEDRSAYVSAARKEEPQGLFDGEEEDEEG